MSETTFTPGIWKWLNYPDGRKLLAGSTQAVIHCPDAPMGVDEADQHLIAAAPDLYAALEAAGEALNGLAPDDWTIHDAIKAVLLKARGGAPQ